MDTVTRARMTVSPNTEAPMTDEELCDALRRWDWDKAADRIEALSASLSNMASLFAKEAAEKQVALGEVEANQKERDSFYEEAMHHIALWGETLTEKSKVEAELKSAKLRIEVLHSVCRGLSDQLMVAQAEIANTLGVEP